MIVLAYLAAVVAANLLVAHFGPGASVWIAFVFVAFDLTSRDKLHDRWHGHRLGLKMAALIAAGGALSYALNRGAGTIALASTVAFVASATLDALAYHLLRGRRKAVRVNGSNLVSALADSLAFPYLAFGGFLPLIALGQFAAKAGGGLLWYAVLRRHGR